MLAHPLNVSHGLKTACIISMMMPQMVLFQTGSWTQFLWVLQNLMPWLRGKPIPFWVSAWLEEPANIAHASDLQSTTFRWKSTNQISALLGLVDVGLVPKLSRSVQISQAARLHLLEDLRAPSQDLCVIWDNLRWQSFAIYTACFRDKKFTSLVRGGRLVPCSNLVGLNTWGLTCRTMTTVQDVENAADIFASSKAGQETFMPMTVAVSAKSSPVKTPRPKSASRHTPTHSPSKGQSSVFHKLCAGTEMLVLIRNKKGTSCSRF